MIDINKISEDEYAELFLSRQPIEKSKILKRACVGIAGAGGLGSVVAENLARAGVGKLIVADFDRVEPSNLNRQRFSLSQLGMLKVAALTENIKNLILLLSLLKLVKKLPRQTVCRFLKIVM